MRQLAISVAVAMLVYGLALAAHAPAAPFPSARQGGAAPTPRPPSGPRDDFEFIYRGNQGSTTPMAFGPTAFTAGEENEFNVLAQLIDPSAKLAGADTFLEKYPQSQLAGHVNRFRMEAYIATGNFKEAFAAGERALDFEDRYLQRIVAQAGSDKNARNSVPYREFVAQERRIQMYYYQNLMRSAQEMNDASKVMEYGDKALKNTPNDLYSLITVSTVRARRRPANAGETEHSLRIAEDTGMRALEGLKKLANGSRKNEMVAAVYISLGLVHSQRNDYVKAEKSYRAALAAVNTDGEAYMLLGIAYAGQRPPKLDAALENLAKSVLMKGVTESEARERLTSLYEAVRQSRDGIDQFIERVGAGIQK